MNTATLAPVSFPSPRYVAHIVNTHHQLSDAERSRRAAFQEQIDDSWFFHDHPEKVEVHWDPLTGAFTHDVIEDEPKPKTGLVLVRGRGRAKRRRCNFLVRAKKGLINVTQAAALLATAPAITLNTQKVQKLKLTRLDGRRFLTREEHRALKEGKVLRNLQNVKLTPRQQRLLKDNKQRNNRSPVRSGRQLYAA